MIGLNKFVMSISNIRNWNILTMLQVNSMRWIFNTTLWILFQNIWKASKRNECGRIFGKVAKEPSQQDGSVRPTFDMLHLHGPLQDTQAATMSALLLPGVHGGPGGLCQEAGQVSRVQGWAQGALQWDTGLPNQLHPAKVFGTPCRDHRWVDCSIDARMDEPLHAVI